MSERALNELLDDRDAKIADRDAQIADLREQLDSKRVDELMADNRILKLVEELRISHELKLCPLHKKHKRFCADCATELENAEADLRVAAAYEAAHDRIDRQADAVLALTPASAQVALDAHDRKIAKFVLQASHLPGSWLENIDKSVDELLAQCKAGE